MKNYLSRPYFYPSSPSRKSDEGEKRRGYEISCERVFQVAQWGQKVNKISVCGGVKGYSFASFIASGWVLVKGVYYYI